jgi:hypothetical protein
MTSAIRPSPTARINERLAKLCQNALSFEKHQ